MCVCACIYIYIYIGACIYVWIYIYIYIYAFLIIWCLFCWTISQNIPQFLISLLHWSQLSFPGAFFCCQQTASSCWEPDLENRVGTEATQSAIHVVLPLLWSPCDLVHCLGEKALFSPSLVAVFWRFLPSNAPLMLYNIHYWWVFFSQSNWWTKYFVAPKIRRPKPFLLIFESLVDLDGFHLMLSTQLTTDLILEWSGGSMFHPLSHIYAKTPSCFIETVANNALNCQHIVVFDQLWANAAHTLNTVYWWTIHAKCWIHCPPPDIFNSSAISHNFNLRSAKTNLLSFLVFSGTSAKFGQPEHSASFVSVWPCSKSTYHLLTVVFNGAESK